MKTDLAATNAGRADGSDAAIVSEACQRVAHIHGDLAEVIDDEIRKMTPLHSEDGRRRLVEEAVAQLGGLGELDKYLRDPDVDEVMVNAGREIWIDRAGLLEHVGSLSIDRVGDLIERILAPIGRRVDRSSPIVDARLPDGARICAVLPPVAVDGATLSIRRFSELIRPLTEFTDCAGVTLCQEILAARCNVLITGATSSGKTSLVASLLKSLPDQERLIVVEDTTELPVSTAHMVRLEARPQLVDGPREVNLGDLVRTALRLRPDRIVVGEVRGGEVLALVQAMNTGHDGSLSTCHANGPLDALLRLESLVLQAAPTWPLAAIREQLARSLDVIVHIERDETRRSRQITTISEVIHRAPETGETMPGPALRTLAERRAGGTMTIVAGLERSRR
ncbi:MAG: CpaF family protein [Actinobacteria bacterium]|nr:MAG: CpaF family protein [Actinomycetota bacterium]